MVLRVTRLAPKRFLIERKRKFLWIWSFWEKGCYLLGLNKYYSSKLTAETAIATRARKKNVKVVIYK